MNIFKILPVVVLMLLGASACASGSSYTQMSDRDFLNSGADKQSAYIDSLNSDTLALEAKRQAELLAGLRVKYGSGGTETYLQCSNIPGEYNAMGVYPAHDPEGLETASWSAILYYVADKKCNVLYAKGPDQSPYPIKLIGDVVSTESLLGSVVRNSTAAALNGSVAAGISAAAQCDDNCGSTFVMQGGNSVAASQSQANSVANVTTSVDTPCGSACRVRND